MDPSDVSLTALAAAARVAGERIMFWYEHAGLAATAKADESPVTQADLAAHQALAAELPRLLPGVPIVSEEDGMETAAALRVVHEAPVYWLVDPLDGTRDYLKRTGEFCVSIALMIAGQPQVGCVYAPTTGVCFLAARGRGAFKQGETAADLTPLRTRRADHGRFVCLISRSHGGGEDDFMRRTYPQAQVKSLGSALKYAAIAEGAADLSFRKTPTSLWDTAAAQCILEVAGGALLDWQGMPLSYRTGSLINPPLVALGDRGFPWQDMLANIVAQRRADGGGV